MLRKFPLRALLAAVALVSIPSSISSTASTGIAVAAAPSKSDATQSSAKWTCPMHPHYIASEFGTCPICGMDLVKLEAGGAAGAEASGTPAQRTAITIAPETLQTMGVRLAKAELSTFGRIIRSYGRVADNERLQSELTARLEGWIEDLRVRAVGDQVKAGDLLFTIYAPEFTVSQRDYLDALGSRDRRRIESIKTRLRAFGMQDRAIEELVRNGAALEFVPFYADRDGTIAMIDLRPGSYVKRGTMLTRIQNYSEVWLMVSVPEKDLGFISVGTPASISFPNLPGRIVPAKVEYLYPTVDPATRTGTVRLVLENPDGQLRPGAYADVAFEVAAEPRLAVPSEAILMSGGARYVVASLGDGRFEPRAVKTGITSGKWTEISGEVQAGEEIVVSGQFLIDSESALRESFRKLERLQLPLSVLNLTAAQFAMVDHFPDAALYIHEALTDGYDIEPKFLAPAIEVRTLLWPAFQHTRLAFVMDDSVKALERAKSATTVSETRTALAELVAALEPWMRDGSPDHYAKNKVALYLDQASGRKWIQLAGKPLNPYGGGDAKLLPWPQAKEAAEPATPATATRKENTVDAPPASAAHRH